MMRDVSANFRSVVSSSHRMVARARLVTPGQTGVNPGPFDDDGKPLYELPIEDGDVQLDPTAQIRATANVSTLFPWPDGTTPLDIYGEWELFLERGVVYGSGSREWVSLGYYRLDDLEQDDAPHGTIEINAPDRMAAIIDARLEQPRQYNAATTIRFVVEDLVQEVYPDAVISLEGFDADVAIGSMQIVERDRYEFLLDIAKSHGCTMFFDYDGRFRMSPVPDATNQTPVWTIRHGSQGVLVNLRRNKSRKSIFNAVVAEGEQAGDELPVRGVAYDDNPTSKTRWGGPFGRVPRFYTSSFLRTDAQALAAAQAMLARSIGIPYTVSFGFVPNPALEPLDVVAVSYDNRVGIEVHVLDKMTIPLTATGVMTAATRLQPGGE